MTRVRPWHLVPGDGRHGVARYAREIALAAGCRVVTSLPPDPGGRIHLHFTDRLWGSDPEAAAQRIERLARLAPLTVTLHDLPQSSDGPTAWPRRAEAYQRVVSAADAVTCSSKWEVDLLAQVGRPRRSVEVIPLPVLPFAAMTAGHGVWDGPAVIGVLGWLYPGKGLEEAVDVAATLRDRGRPVGVLALGSAAPGHGADVVALQTHAARRHVDLTVTGYLSDADLFTRARQVTVPLAAHQHISASGSINSWLAAGRRPLVADSVYAREIATLRPGTIHRYGPGELLAAVEQVLASPERSWLRPDVDLSPGPAETAAAYLRWWSEVAS